MPEKSRRYFDGCLSMNELLVLLAICSYPLWSIVGVILILRLIQFAGLQMTELAIFVVGLAGIFALPKVMNLWQ
jgi:hypothetical protein